jgi:hypothetical protein
MRAESRVVLSEIRPTKVGDLIGAEGLVGRRTRGLALRKRQPTPPAHHLLVS